jgi:hypothetical protein
MPEPLYLQGMSIRGQFDTTLGGFKNWPRRFEEKKADLCRKSIRDSPFVMPAG